MSKQSSVPVNPAKMSAINELVNALSMLLTDLLAASRASTNPDKLGRINAEMLFIQNLLNQAAQAQNAADDAMFAQVTRGLKAQAKGLSGMDAQVSAIVSDAAKAGTIAGYIGQAITLIHSL